MIDRGRSADAPAVVASTRSKTLPIWLAVAALSPACLLLALLSPVAWIPAVLGRAHPMVLHFPIALLLVVAAMEAIETVSRGRIRCSSGFVLFAGAFGAVLAAACGFLLMRADAVEGPRVDRHLLGGVTVATVAVFAVVVHAFLERREGRGARLGYRALLFVLCGALVITGHD
ncbi:MAG: DUF2231 domain-containing protein, partial [Opitutus sp.]